MQTIYALAADDYIAMLQDAGLTIVDSPAQAQHAACIWQWGIRDFAALCAPYGNLHVNIDAIDKQVLASTFSSLGYEVIPHVPLTSRQSIDVVPWVPFFSKPSWATARQSPSPFDYVTYSSKEAAYAAFDADNSNTVGARNAILQPSYSVNGRTNLYMVSASVNGAGVISIEPVLVLVQREHYGHFYSAVRGGSDGLPHVEMCKEATRQFIQTSGIRNTHIKIQFISNGTTYLPMDLGYSFDYISMHVIPKLGIGSTYHLDRIRFAYDMIPTPPVFSDVTSLRLIDIRPDVDAGQVQAAMQTHNIKFLNALGSQRYRMFGNVGQSKAAVMASMDAFEAEVGNA